MLIDLSLLILFVFDFALIYMIYFYNPSGTINRFFILLIIPIMLSNIVMLLLRTMRSELLFDIGLNMAFLSALAFFPLFYHFSFYYPRNVMNALRRKRLILIYTSAALLGILLFFTYLVRPESSVMPSPARVIEYFRMIPLFFASFITAMIYMLSLLLLTIFRFFCAFRINLMAGEKRNVIMILAGFIPTSFALLFSYFLFLPSLGGVYIYIFASSFYTVYFILLLFSFGYVDRIAAVRTLLTYPIMLLIVFVLFNYGLLEINENLSLSLNLPLQFILLAEILLLILIFQPVIRLIESRLFRAGTAVPGDFHRLLKSSAAGLSGIISLNELDDFLDDVFRLRLGVDHFHLVIRDPSNGDFCDTRRGPSSGIVFPGGGELQGKLEGYRKIMNMQQIALAWHEGPELSVLFERKIILIAPLFVEAELVGACLFGEPGPARAWYPSEIEELELMMPSVAVVIARCNTHARAIALEKKQAQIEKMAVLSEISSGIAHEVRNPLSIISASAETLAERELSPEDVRKFAAYIQDEAGRVGNLLNRILSVSVGTAVSHKPVDVKAVAGRALDLVGVKFRRKGLRAVFEADGDHCIAVIDKEVLLQICLNLILNALDAMHPGDLLSLRTSYTAGERVRLLVMNEGDPVPPELRARIFDPFFTTKEGGTGLGLSISQRLVREAGGEIGMLESEELTIFQILLPAAADFMR